MWRLRKNGGTFVCFNASYDLSRIASGWHAATKSSRRGSSFLNGFELTRTFATSKDEAGRPMLDEGGDLRSRIVETPFVRIRRDDRHHVRYDMRAANVLDLATLAFALRDESDTLQGTCEAFGVPFNERPGFHDGTVTKENVEGCLHDLAKTGELLYALGREYDRHPIDLPPWRAQSGASFAKAYLRAFGVAPRSELQEFCKDHHGYAASAYFGGWVEARIVREAMPCVYLDALSMYPSAFSLLDLWFGHVVPAHLEPEDLAPDHVQRLLDEVHDHPEGLEDRAFWPRLAFFALIDPNGATLPARADIPSPYLAGDPAKPAAKHRLVTIGPVVSSGTALVCGAGPRSGNACRAESAAHRSRVAAQAFRRTIHPARGPFPRRRPDRPANDESLSTAHRTAQAQERRQTR